MWDLIHPKSLNSHLEADELLYCVVGALFFTVSDAVCQSNYLMSVSTWRDREVGLQ